MKYLRPTPNMICSCKTRLKLQILPTTIFKVSMPDNEFSLALFSLLKEYHANH